VHDTANARSTVSPQPLLDEREIERIKRQISDAARFYWIHSGMRLFLDIDYIIVRDSLQRQELYGGEWWYPPRDSMLEHILTVNGRSIGDFSGILYLTCTQAYDTAMRAYVLAGKGGAFTNGVGTGKGYGISWWDVTGANHNAGNNWLMVHEFNHQLDDIFTASGYPEYWFNHISPTIGTAAKFGEHFDANRCIIRMVPGEEWLDLRYTKLQSARDADEDGIPDNDSTLPLDEARLGSDSTRSDTDGDGVGDFDELAFSNWIREGWGETMSANTMMPNLHDRDTDHDGIPDGEDPIPCSALTSAIQFGKPTRIGKLQDGRFSGVVESWWDEDSLYFLMALDRSVPVKVMVDGHDDGWFTGRENILFTLTPDGDSLVTKAQVFNATDPAKWPFMDDELPGKLHFNVRLSRNSTGYELRIALRQDRSAGFSIHDHSTTGVLIGFLLPSDDAGNKRYVDLFEPNRFIELTFVK
jgi:hypothetical protein